MTRTRWAWYSCAFIATLIWSSFYWLVLKWWRFWPTNQLQTLPLPLSLPRFNSCSVHFSLWKRSVWSTDFYFWKKNCFSHKKEVGETLKLKQKQFSVTPSLTYALFARHFVQCNSFALVIRLASKGEKLVCVAFCACIRFQQIIHALLSAWNLSKEK